MKEIVFASNNPNKLKEIQAVLKEIKILSLNDIGCNEELPETKDTLEGNALQKASYVKENYGYDCFADDTGLMVDALGGRPGVYSARYAGEACNAENNMNKLLNELEGKNNRSAKFMTVIALVQGDKYQFFHGEVEGLISTERHGEEGFGYDPIFFPEGRGVSFAQMSNEEKNKISHRGRAVAKLMDYFNQ